ncbi:MAG: hypothetical protein NC124_11055 [Clostridium sp.]|nr:hypothetical protein [Clostridium sp.]
MSISIAKKIEAKSRWMKEGVLSDIRTFLGRDQSVTNIFDYNYVARRRYVAKKREVYSGNELYGIGYCLNRYAKYSGAIYIAVEHAMFTYYDSNDCEIIDNKMPVVFVASKKRKEIIQNKTKKQIIPYGPHFIPYAEPIYDDFTMNAIRKNLGRTIVVYPKHNNLDGRYKNANEEFGKLMDKVYEIKSEYAYDTVLVCMYFADIYNGQYLKCNKYDCEVVTAGHNRNYDFADCSKTILELADLVIAQSYSTVIEATYLKKPAIFVPGAVEYELNNGAVYEDESKKIKTDVTIMECTNLFGTYHENISKEQYEWGNLWGGYESVLSPEELRSILKKCKRMR